MRLRIRILYSIYAILLGKHCVEYYLKNCVACATFFITFLCHFFFLAVIWLYWWWIFSVLYLDRMCIRHTISLVAVEKCVDETLQFPFRKVVFFAVNVRSLLLTFTFFLHFQFTCIFPVTFGHFIDNNNNK